MIRRKTLSDKGVAALKPRAARYAHPDPSSAATTSASRQPARKATAPSPYPLSWCLGSADLRKRPSMEAGYSAREGELISQKDVGLSQSSSAGRVSW